jgi:aspartyl-tRNA(Asn)/glutamyl-tRNA(Gln) amidotransferase subunit C
MSLSREDVVKIAHLARLALTPDEMDHYRHQLSAVLEYAHHLNELDLTGVDAERESTNLPDEAIRSDRRNGMRQDMIAPSLPLADALFNAAETAQDQFLIQSVLEE